LIKAQKILIFKPSENKVVYGDLLHRNIYIKGELVGKVFQHLRTALRKQKLWSHVSFVCWPNSRWKHKDCCQAWMHSMLNHSWQAPRMTFSSYFGACRIAIYTV